MKAFLASLLAALVLAAPAQAAFPEKPVRFVVAFAPGSSTDIVARLIAQQLTEINKALGSAPVKERFETLALEAQPSDRETLRRYVESETLKWGRFIKDIGIKAE
jgi:tripartite-type tricarboxylate transporter receptor subunit TctC